MSTASHQWKRQASTRPQPTPMGVMTSSMGLAISFRLPAIKRRRSAGVVNGSRGVLAHRMYGSGLRPWRERRGAVDVGGVDLDRFEPPFSAASNDTVSSSRSMTVCSRRAPMFSVFSFTLKAISAMRRTPSVANFTSTVLGAQQRLVLRGQRGIGLGEDAHEVVHLQRTRARRGSGSGPAAPESDPRASTCGTRPRR